MAVKFNPFTGQLQIDEKGSGGGSAFFAGEVATYADLPLDGTAALNSRWLVRSNSGTWPFSSYKQAGIYIRTATGGTDRDADYDLTDTSFHDVMSDDAFLIFDNTDPTKAAKFDVGANVSAGQTRTLSVPNASGRIQVEGQPIGNTTPAAGTFTTLAANNGLVSTSIPALTVNQVWNASGVNFTAFQLRCDETVASGSGTLLADFGLSPNFQRFTIDKAGNTTAAGLASAENMRVNNAEGSFYWNAGAAIVREGNDIIAFRRTTNPNTFRLYNTFTDASNHERGFMRWSSNVLQIGTEKAGTGSARALALQTDGITRVTVDTTGQVGIGVAPERPFHIQGSAAFARIDRQGNFGPAILLTRMATGTTVTSSWLFGPTDQVAGVVNDDFAIIDFGTAVGGTSGTQRLTISKSTGQLTVNGNLNLPTKDLVTDTTTGTKIGTGTTQKIGFFNATPVVQQAAVADATDAASTQARLNDLLARVRTLGLIAT